MAESRNEAVAADEQADEPDSGLSDCAHHWEIESPNGPTSVGVCKVCGETKEFRNSITSTGWDRGQGQARRKANEARLAREKAARQQR